MNFPKLGFFHLAKSYEETSTFPPGGSKGDVSVAVRGFSAGGGWGGRGIEGLLALCVPTQPQPAQGHVLTCLWEQCLLHLSRREISAAGGKLKHIPTSSGRSTLEAVKEYGEPTRRWDQGMALGRLKMLRVSSLRTKEYLTSNKSPPLRRACCFETRCFPRL